MVEDSRIATLPRRRVYLRWLGALDDKPQHEGDLPENKRLEIRVQLAGVFGQKYAGKAEDHPSEAREHKPYAEKPRQESRFVNEIAQREKPKAPKQFGEDQSAAMQIDKQHRKSIALGLFECGKEVGASHQRQRSHRVDFVQKCDRNRGHNQNHHQRGELPIAGAPVALGKR
jgi:hypothetical protein